MDSVCCQQLSLFPLEKRCKVCGVTKPFSAYYRSSTGRGIGGVVARCKECMLAALRALPEGEKARRRERHRADLRRYWADGRTKEKADAWRHKNREHVNAYYRQRYRDHTERVNGYIKKWQERNGERYRALGQRYQERLVAAPGHYTGQDLKALYHAQLGLCAYCQKTLEGGYSIDHKQPVSRGGSNWPDNLCLCCRRCNSRKGPKTAEEFCAWLTAPRP